MIRVRQPHAAVRAEQAAASPLAFVRAGRCAIRDRPWFPAPHIPVLARLEGPMRFAAICLVLASVFLALAVGVRLIGQGAPRGVEPRDQGSASEVFTRANEAYELAGR